MLEADPPDVGFPAHHQRDARSPLARCKHDCRRSTNLVLVAPTRCCGLTADFNFIVMELGNDKYLVLISLYEGCPELWQPDHKHYFNKVKLNDAWEAIAAQLQLLKL